MEGEKKRTSWNLFLLLSLLPLLAYILVEELWGETPAVIMALVTLILGLNGWPISRLWFWQLVAAMTSLIGLQLLIGWFIIRVLEDLSQRDRLVGYDMRRTKRNG